MTVRALLQNKGNFVSTVGPETRVQEVMDQLERDEVSALVVVGETGDILGIVSGGDVVRGLNRLGPEIVEKPVMDVMTSEVFTCDIAEPLSAIYELMDTNRIRHIPILEASQLRGIVNTLDVVKYRLREIENEAEALKEYVSGRT